MLQLAPETALYINPVNIETSPIWKELKGGKYVEQRERLPIAISRYLRAPLPDHLNTQSVFHSSYYRLPHKKHRIRPICLRLCLRKIPQRSRAHSSLDPKAPSHIFCDRTCCISESTRRDLIELYGESFAEKSFVTHLARQTYIEQSLSLGASSLAHRHANF